MSRYVEINKSGNNYTVNPNAQPSGNVTLYAWYNTDWSGYCYTLKETPSVGDSVIYRPFNDNGDGAPFTLDSGNGITTVTAVSGDEITTEYSMNSDYNTFVRHSEDDVPLV